MITIERYTKEKAGEWDAFVRSAKNSLFLFERGFMDYHSDRFADHSLLFWEEGKLMALLPANEKDHCLYSHQGLTYGGLLLGNDAKQHTVDECFERLGDYLKEHGFERLLYKAVPHLYHLQPAEEDRYALFRAGAGIFSIAASTVVNLRDALKMPKGRKAQISRAKREGVRIEKLTARTDFENFIALENEVLTQRHNTHAVHTAQELYLLYERFPENIVLYGAKQGEELIAGTVLFVYRNAVHTQYMAANEEARRIGALDLAVATVLSDYTGKADWLDFGISTEENGTILNEGLIAQKEGFGGRTNVYECWELAVSEWKK